MITCPHCNTANPDQNETCVQCGRKLPPAQAAAGTAGATIAVSPAGEKDKTVAIGSSGSNTTLVDSGPATTQVLSTPTPFTPLPEGAIIGAPPHEYQIEQLKEESDQQNSYRARSVQPVRICLECTYLYNPAGETQCRYCQAALAESPPVHLHTTVLERPHSDAFTIEAHLLEAELVNPALRLPPVVLTKRVGGRERRYLVLAPPPAEWLAERQPPQALTEVLEWGVALANALAALHDQQVAYGPLEEQRAGLEAGRASLTEFSKCFYPGREALYQQDIRHLASLILYLLTGKRKYSSSLKLPAALEPVLLRGLREQHSYASASAFARALDEVLAEIRRPVSVDYIMGRRTDVGQARKLNEDSMLTLELVMNNQSISYPLGVYAVADGMGGHSAGEVASGTALAAVSQSAVTDLLTLDPGGSAQIAFARWVQKAVSAANTAVHDYMKATDNDMGTTLVLALLVENIAYLANVGDSRAYLITAEGIQQITVDHSLVERLVATGQITPEEARYHPQRNVIYRTIGDKPEIEPDTWEIQLQPGDQLLLCSDGLCGMVEDQQMLEIVRSAVSPQAACNALVSAANVAGGTDNITAVLVQVMETG